MRGVAGRRGQVRGHRHGLRLPQPFDLAQDRFHELSRKTRNELVKIREIRGKGKEELVRIRGMVHPVCEA